MRPLSGPPRGLVLLLVLGVAACSSPPAGGFGQAPASTGLSADQTADLLALGAPVLVPRDPGAFRLAEVTAERIVDAGVASVFYRLQYRRGDGACFEVSGSNEGLGGPALPLVSRPVRLAALPGRPTVALYQAAGDPAASSAQDWGPGTVVSDYIEIGDLEAGGMAALFRSARDAGCRPLSLDEATPLVASLRLLTGAPAAPERPGPPAPPRPPAPADLSNLGAFADAPAVRDDPAVESGQTPEEAARGLADRYDGAARSVEVQIVQSVGDEATVLVTATGLADDSVEGERYRLVYREGEGGTWFVEDAGVQVRCHAGRGHAGWSAAPCN